MLHASIEGIVVTDSKLFNRTGDIGRWAAAVEASFTANAILHAPSSLESGRPNKSRANAAFPSGSMRLSISGDVERVGIRHYVTTVSVNVPYALYVIKGTGPWIFARSSRIPKGQPGAGQFSELEEGSGMFLPGQPGWKARRRQRVRGQTANNFLGAAFDATARSHSSLHGFQMVG